MLPVSWPRLSIIILLHPIILICPLRIPWPPSRIIYNLVNLFHVTITSLLCVAVNLNLMVEILLLMGMFVVQSMWTMQARNLPFLNGILQLPKLLGASRYLRPRQLTLVIGSRLTIVIMAYLLQLSLETTVSCSIKLSLSVGLVLINKMV